MALPKELSDIKAILTARPRHPVADAMKTIYSLYWRETREAVDELWDEKPHLFYERAYDGGQEQLPQILLDAWREASPYDLGSSFPYAYVAGGASEVIKDLILPGMRLNFFEGDYEGFAATARSRGVEVRTHSRATIMADLETSEFTDRDVFWLTDPSSIDGDHWDQFEDFLDKIYWRNPQVGIVLDATYVGAVRNPRVYRLWKYPNLKKVIFSVSKPFGAYYHRCGGVFSRDEIPTLWANKWFCNPFSLSLATLLIRRYGLRGELPRKHAGLQESVLRRAIASGTLPASAVAGNVVLFAIAPDGPTENRRVDGVYRFCLTPGMYRELYPEEGR